MDDFLGQTIGRIKTCLLRFFAVLLLYLKKAATRYQLAAHDLLRFQNARTDTKDTFPLAGTVLTSLLVLLLFLFCSVPALMFPTIVVKKLVIVLNVSFVSVLILVFVIDIYTSKQKRYCKHFQLTSCFRG
jgi:hypothetical protein